MPIHHFLHLPMPMWVQMIYAFTMLARWSKMSTPVKRSPTAAIRRIRS